MTTTGRAYATRLDPRVGPAWLGLEHRLAALLDVWVAIKSNGTTAQVTAAGDAQQLLAAISVTNPRSSVLTADPV